METEGFVYLQSGSAVSLNMCVLCVFVFLPLLFLHKIAALLHFKHLHLSEPIFLHILPSVLRKAFCNFLNSTPPANSRETLRNSAVKKKWGNRTVLLPRNEPPCTAGSAVQPGPTRMAVTHVLGFLVPDFMLENHPDEELHQIKIKIKT